MKIKWTKAAQLDLENLREYIRKDSEFYANRFIEKIIFAVEKLEKFPQMGRHVPESKNPKVKEIIVQNQRVIYRIYEEDIVIFAIIHTARDLSLHTPKPWEII